MLFIREEDHEQEDGSVVTYQLYEWPCGSVVMWDGTDWHEG